MIHVAYGLYDKDGRYSKFTGTSMLSLFENTSAPPHSVLIHILHDNTLTQDNRDKFIYIAGRYNQQVKFYNVDVLCPDKIAEIKKSAGHSLGFKNFSIGTAFRLLINYLLSKDIMKIIYLDADTIINLDIWELWQIELGDKPIAAVPEPLNGVDTKNAFYMCINNFVEADDYCNGGVLVLNLEIWRNMESLIQETMNFVFTKTPALFMDQDILNYAFAKKKVKLPLKFNTFVLQARDRGDTEIKPAIYHYVGDSLKLNQPDNFNQLWLKYFTKTPFFNEDTIKNLYSVTRQIYIQEKRLLVNISAIMSGKTRAFFVQSSSAEAIKKIFHCKPEEEFIIADAQDSVENLINSMKLYDGKKIFFIFVVNFPPIYDFLIKSGFAPGKNFVNVAELWQTKLFYDTICILRNLEILCPINTKYIVMKVAI